MEKHCRIFTYLAHSFTKKQKQKKTRVPTFVWLFRDDATTAKGSVCDEGTNLRLREFAVVPLMPTRNFAFSSIQTVYFSCLHHSILINFLL